MGAGGGCSCSSPAGSSGTSADGVSIPGSSGAACACQCDGATPESPLGESVAVAPSPGTGSAFSVSAGAGVPAGAASGTAPSSSDVAVKSKRVLVATSVTLTVGSIAPLAAVKMASNCVKITAVITNYTITPTITVVLQGTNDFENWTTVGNFNTAALGRQDFTPPTTGVAYKAVRIVLLGPGSGTVILDDVCMWIATV